MNSARFFLCVSLVCIAINSCNFDKKDTVYVVDVENLLVALDNIDGNIRTNKNLLGYFVLPNEGCKPCIEKIEDRLVQGIDLDFKAFGFIFTRIGSIKLFYQKEIVKKTIGSQNVYIDSLGLLDQAGYSHIYPSIIYLKDGGFDRFVLVKDPDVLASFK